METNFSTHVWSILVTLLAFTSMLFLWDNSLALTLLFLAILLVLLILRKSITDVYVAVIVVVLSLFFEVISVYLGIWQHMNPDYFGVPLWIPISWALFALFVRSLGALFTRPSETSTTSA